MRKKAAVLTAILLISTLGTGCHGTYQNSGEYEDQEIIISDNTGDETGKGSIELDYGNQNNKDDEINVSGENISVEIDAGAVDESVNPVNDSLGEGTAGNQTEPYDPNEADSAYKVFDGALFIGDSRTEGLQLYSGIKNADFFCAKGMTIDKINDGEKVYFSGGSEVSIYDVLDSGSYKKVFIGLGMNELGMKYIEDYVEEYDSLIATVKEKQPNAEIYVQALLPVTQEKSDNHDYINNAQIYWYNTHIVEIAENNEVTYINADAPLVNESGALCDKATTDGVHMNREYCRKWADELARLVQ